jgi:glycosyltransferase involved in cell wall biosynthesis
MTINPILTVYIALFCGIWIAMFLYFIWQSKRLVSFHETAVSAPVNWPRLSVIGPAGNEATHIEEAVKSIIGQDYPDLEIILVDDRSTDNTGKVIDALAGSDSRVKAIHVDNLPEKWLGKVHALHQGVKRATGDWLLFTDADIHFSHGTLRKSIAYVLQEKVEHLALVPGVIIHGFWLQVLIRTFGLMFLLSTRADQVNKRNSDAFVGVGAFNLVNKAFFDQTPGFEWLRMEVADDMGVGLMIKQAGGQSHVAMADEDLSINWYPTVSAMFRGMEKNTFGAGPRYQLTRLILLVLVLVSISAAPYLAVLSSSSLLSGLGIVAIALHVVFAIFFVRDKRSETLSLLLFAVGLLLFCLIMIRAAYKCTLNQGIDWRGTHYSLDALKAGQRVKL